MKTQMPSTMRLDRALPFLRDLPRERLRSLAKKRRFQKDTDIGGMPLDYLRDGRRRRLFTTAIAETVIASSRQALHLQPRYISEPLIRLVPAMHLVSHQKIDSLGTSVRLRNLLQTHAGSNWQTVSQLSLADVLKWRTLGVKTAIEFLSFVIDSSLRALLEYQPAKGGDAHAGPREPGDDGNEAYQGPIGRDPTFEELEILRAMRTIAAWGAAEHGVGSLPEVLKLAGEVEELPAEVGGALDILSSVDLKVLSASEYVRFDVAAALDNLIGELDERELAVFASRPLATKPAPTLQELASTLGVTRERVRQIESKSVRKVRQALSRSDGEVIVRASKRLSRDVGAAYQLERFRAIHPEFAAEDRLTEAAAVRLRLLLWIAGPYKVHAGWLVRAPAADVVGTTIKLLDEVTRDGPVDAEEAIQSLESAQIREEMRRDWVGSLAGFRFMDRFLVRWRGGLADKSDIVLQIRGVPMTMEEISDEIGDVHSPRTLANCLFSDERFRRRGLHHFGLERWGGDEYSSIVDELSQEIVRQGGEARIDRLVSTLVSNFGVSERSVRSYASGPTFVRTGRGTIRVRTQDDLVPATRSIEFTKRCYRIEDGWAYRLTITEDTLRGSGVAVPVGVATHIGLRPTESMILHSSSGDISASWRSQMPSLGSTRAAVEQLNGNVGDWLFVEFLGASQVRFKLVKREAVEEVQGPKRLFLEIGAPRAEDVIGALAYAVGLEDETVFSIVAVRRRLRARGEEDLLTLLPEPTSHADEKALAELTGLIEPAEPYITRRRR